MLISSRTYRLMAALMAVPLLVGGSLPLVQHVCAMTIGPGQTDEHPCPHKTQPQASSGDCCAVEATPAITTQGVRLLKRSLKSVVVRVIVAGEALSPPNSPPSHALFFDTGPPPVSVSLHLLHAVLLN